MKCIIRQFFILSLFCLMNDYSIVSAMHSKDFYHQGIMVDLFNENQIASLQELCSKTLEHNEDFVDSCIELFNTIDLQNPIPDELCNAYTCKPYEKMLKRIFLASLDPAVIQEAFPFECTHEFHAHTNDRHQRITSLSISAIVVLGNGDKVATGSYDHSVKIWNTQSWNCLHEFHHFGAIRVITPVDDHRILTGSADKTVRLWDIYTGECLHTFLDRRDQSTRLHYSHDHAIKSVGVTSDKQFMVTSADEESCMKFWNFETFELIKDFI